MATVTVTVTRAVRVRLGFRAWAATQPGSVTAAAAAVTRQRTALADHDSGREKPWPPGRAGGAGRLASLRGPGFACGPAAIVTRCHGSVTVTVTVAISVEAAPAAESRTHGV